jgi:uncharacterized protein involved in outer membrane biogenesis
MFRHGWKLVVLIIVAAVLFLWLIKAPIMSSYLTKKMGVQVTVRTISMWPSETTIRHFRIANPYGFQSRTAFDVERTKINYRWGALRSQPSEIDLITLDNVTLNIEILGSPSNNNWSAIGAQMPENKGAKKEVIIHKLILRNLTVNTSGAGAKKLGIAGTQHFDQMEFDEIDSRNGFPTKELIRRIFQGAGLRQYIENLLNPTEQIKKAIQKPFKLFGGGATPGSISDPRLNVSPEDSLEGAQKN